MQTKEFYHTTVNNGQQSVGEVSLDCIKCEIMCAYDTVKDFTWTFVNGARRVFKIEFSSSLINAKYGLNAKVVRDFSYMGSAPFDLTSITDTLVLL
jgi:hypothetical protein